MKTRYSEGSASSRAWDGLLTVLGATLIGCVLLNFANVVARYVFNTALFGIEELQVYMMVSVAFLGAAVVTFRREHLRMDALVHRFGRGTNRALSMIERVAVVALVGFACVQSARFTWQMVQINRKSDLMEIPMWIPHGSVTVGLFLIASISAWRLFSAPRVDEHQLEAPTPPTMAQATEVQS